MSENENEDYFEGMSPEEIKDWLASMLPGAQQEEAPLADVIAASPYSLVGDKPTHPEDIPPVHDYEVVLTFSTRDTRAQVEEFFEEVMESMPNGTRSSITTSGQVVSVDDLKPEHLKSRIRVTVSGRLIEGTLDAVYDSGLGSGISKTLVIDGKAWVMSFGVVELNV